MARLITLGEGVSLTSAAAQAAQATDDTPFARGFDAICTIVLTGATGTPTVKIQTSPDGSTWSDAVTLSSIANSSVKREIALDKYARLNVTAAGSAGVVSAYLE